MFKRYIILLLCAFAQGELDLEKPDFVRTKEMNMSRGVTFPFANNLATASKNSTHIQLNIFEDSKNIIGQCNISLKNDIIGRLNAATSEDAVVIWGETSTDKADKVQKIRYGGVQVKPLKGCEETSMTIASYQLPEDYLPLKPVILFNKENFQVINPLQQDCPACQFNENDKSSVPTQGATEGKPSKNLLMKVVRLPNGEDGYFYAYNYDNNTAVIRYLDANRVVLKEKYVDHPVGVADPVKNQSLVNICYEKGVQEVYCGQLDDKLEFRFKERLLLLEKRIVMGLTVSSGPEGELMAATLQTELEKPQKYIVYSYDAEGKMVKTMKFGDLDENKVGDLYSWYCAEGDHYCLHMHETDFLGDLDSHEVIKCINAK